MWVVGGLIAAVLLIAGYLVAEHHLRDYLYARQMEAEGPEYVRRLRIYQRVFALSALGFVVLTVTLRPDPQGGFQAMALCLAVMVVLSAWVMRGRRP